MAEPALPQRPETTQHPRDDAEKRDPSRGGLPSRTAPIPPRRPPPPSPVSTGPRAESSIIPLRRPPVLPPATASPLLHPLPKPAGSPPAPSEAQTNLLPRIDAPATSGNLAGVSVQPGPKKETARVGVLPRPLPPPANVQPAPGMVATFNAIDAFDSIPRWFCWGLLGISAFIFLIQIWNYALS